MAHASRVLGVTLLLLTGPTLGWAQTDATRPATTTFMGDTGLWFVPTGETLPAGSLSLSVHRTELDYRQGNTNVSFWPVTGAVGLGRVELFGALRLVTRIDRDSVPLLFAGPDNEAGGLVNEHPGVNASWTGNRLGDLFLGAKLNLLSQERLQPLALAVRGIVKTPTGDRESGTSTGKYDGFVDIIGSREFHALELTGFGGIALRGDPHDISISDGIRWGAGVGFPPRRSVRATAEISGEWMLDQAVTAPAGLVVGQDGSLSPATSRLTDEINTAVGLTWQHPSGVLLGVGLNYRIGLETPSTAGTPPNSRGDAVGLEFRIGFHGGVKAFVPRPAIALVPPPPREPAAVSSPAPPPTSPAPPAPPASTANRGPAVRARCEPCSVDSGGTVRLRAEATDPDGDALTVVWSATGGTLVDVHAATTGWVADTAPGLVTFTALVQDSHGARAFDTVTIQVTAGEDGLFGNVLFDLDSSRVRPDMLPVLEPVIAALIARPELRLRIEGHACDLGTAEHNLALGEQRASQVRDYLVQRGIAAGRFTTVSFGEERPAYDNAEEATRRLNRRAVLVLDGPDTSSRR